MRSFSFIILSFFLSWSLFAQNNSVHPFSKSFVFTGEGGTNLAGTDFPDMKADYFGRGSIEYYLPTQSKSVFGFKLFAGGGFIAGKGLESPDPLYIGIDEFQTKIVYGGAGIIYSYSLGKVVQPYISGGVSYLIFNPLRTDGKKMPRNAAAEYAKEDIDYMGEVGARFMLSDHFSFNAGYVFNYIDNDNLDDIFSSENDMFHSVFGGFSYYFKFSRDSDGDGVKDEKDVCKDTPAGIAVDEFGCPYDSDYDGIPDYKDLCQGTPRNVQVDSVGCPLDSDSDGIADYLDECPGTLPGVEVDSVGCRKEEIVGLAIEEIEENVPENERILVLGGTANFPLGGSDLLPNPKSGLSRLSEYMKKNPDLEWIIEGHTDNVGNEDKNFQLSLDRAKAVLNYFIDQGMDQEKFTVLAAGSTKPLADNSVEFGRALNRRVVIEEKGSYDRKMEMMTPVNSDNYSLENEFNIESLIFTDGNYFCIQVSSWQSKNKAEKVFKDLIMKGHPAFISETKDNSGDKWYRIRIGYFNNLEGARTYLKTIR